MSSTIETFDFQTEARQLLDLMIHSVYSNKEIFLRELISNSSDALDRRRFEALKNPELLTDGVEPQIFLETDKEERTLSIRDNGIGMSREEVQDLIGTIAKSGNLEFLKKIQEAKESDAPEFIGQFGVGFYSSFMVADRVVLETRRAGEDTATRWESDGGGTYTLEAADRDEVGTTITLHLKDTDHEDGMADFTDEYTLRNIVKKYSDFVAYPISMNVERTEIERDDEGKPKEGAEERTIVEEETLNSMKAIWLKDKDEVTEDELREFYKHISHDWNEPLETIRAKIEGTLEYRLLLFIPSKAPFDLFYREGRSGLNLYVRRVFIMDDCKELVPEYLRFVRGVVDSEDLSLNISREILQQDRQIERIRKGIVGKVLDALQNRAKNEDDYLLFWNEFGRVLKEGIYGDRDNSETLLKLLRCETTHEDVELTSLQGYIDRMQPDQDKIYYIAGESRKALENSPHLEAFREKGYEVLLFVDPVDEVWTQSTYEYEGKTFQAASKGVAELGTEEEKKREEEERKEKEEEYGSLLECLKAKLDEYVKEVRMSSRLTTSAACLVGDEGDMSPQLEQMMKAMDQKVPPTKRILELNPGHPILAKLQEVYDQDKDAPELDDYAHLLFGQAILAEGGQLPDPGGFSKLVADLMVKVT